ncbi:MAG: hypothetical protein QW821_06160, partial [Candidatus Bathyarchaeia archaeon]
MKKTLLSSARKVAKGERESLWILELLDKPSLAADLNYDKNFLLTKVSSEGLCVACKGSKFLCGKTRCPVIVRANYFFRTVPLLQATDIDGAS